MALRKIPTYYYFLFSILFLLCTLITDTVSKKLDKISTNPTANLYLKNLRFRHKLAARNRSHCPNSRTFLIGARIRSISLVNDTFHSVTALELICSDRIRTKLYSNFIHTKNPLVLEKNIGTWGDIEECPNGLFATGLTFYLQPQPLSTLNTDYDYDMPTVGRSHFISGVSLNCKYENEITENPNTNDADLNNTAKANSTAIPIPTSVILGQSSDKKIEIACQHQTVISGAEVFEERIRTKNKVRMAQVKLSLKCSHLVNPAQYCTPELRWERIGNVICQQTPVQIVTMPPAANQSSFIEIASTSTSTQPQQNEPAPGATTCHVYHSVGTVPNMKISNLDNIMSAYYPLGLDTDRNLGNVILKRLKSRAFRLDWKQKYSLKATDYKLATESAELYSSLKNTTFSFQLSTKVPSAVSQVVGHCSIYKIYFPILKEWLD